MIWGCYSPEGTGSFRIRHHLKNTFSIQLEKALKFSKLGHGLQRKINAAFSLNVGNYKTGLGLQTVCQNRLGLCWELMSLLITCISLAPAKGARLVAPGSVSPFISRAGTAEQQAITDMWSPATIPPIQGPGERRVMRSQRCDCPHGSQYPTLCFRRMGSQTAGPVKGN